MRKLYKNILVILNAEEKHRMKQLIFFDILISVLDIAFLVMLLWIIQFYTDSSSLKYLKDTFLMNYPLIPVVVFFILFSVKNFIGFNFSRLQLKFVYGVAARLSQKKMVQYLNGSYHDYVHVDSSVNIRRISQQPIEFGHYVLSGFQQIISQSVLIFFTLLAILMYDPVLFSLLLAILLPPVLFISYLMKKKLNRIRKTAKPLSEKTIQYLKEALSAFVESNIYSRKSFFANRYNSLQSAFNHFLSEQQAVQNMPSRLIEVFAIFGLLVLIFVQSIANANSVSIITIGAFMAAAYKIIPGIVKILSSAGQIKTYDFTLADLTEKDSIFPAGNSGKAQPLQSVSFKNVSYSFRNKEVLSHCSFTISKGDFLGLQGISGKGKTTLVNILLGFLEPDQGEIHINNKWLKATERQQFWERISYVKQQPVLIHDSILKNITLSEDDVDVEKLDNVSRVSGLQEEFARHPEGLDQIITENGKNLSGGQRQRIMLARALYRSFDLLILDEPFSELDINSENRLLGYIRELALYGKMILLITHKKESFSYCNKIVSLNERESACLDDIDARLS